MASKLQETINGYGGNIKPLLDELKDRAKNVQELQAKRDAINAEIGEERAAVKALGISKQAFDFGLKRKEMDEEKRATLDENYSVVCDALGVPLNINQGDLFETSTKEKDNANAKISKEKSIGEQQAEAIQNAANR
jgi:hypothetical protein